jgi:hypothetical protein
VRRPRAALLPGVALGLLLGAAAAHADPALDWMLNCRGCHGAEGAGVGDAVPRLAGEVARFLAVPGGREFLIRVPGVAQSELDDVRLAALLTWMVARFGPREIAAAAAPFSAIQVGRLRRRPLVDVAGVRRAVLGVRTSAPAELRTDAAAVPAARAPRRR